MDARENLPTDALEAAARNLASAIADGEAVIAAEERKLTLLREEHHLISRLLELRGDGTSTASATVPAEPPNGPPAVEAVIAELVNAARPMHITELYRVLHERSIPIPGSGQQANLIALLTRDPRIYRPERGFYALSQWRPETISTPTRTRRVHVRVRKSENETD